MEHYNGVYLLENDICIHPSNESHTHCELVYNAYIMCITNATHTYLSKLI